MFPSIGFNAFSKQARLNLLLLLLLFAFFEATGWMGFLITKVEATWDVWFGCFGVGLTIMPVVTAMPRPQ